MSDIQADDEEFSRAAGEVTMALDDFSQYVDAIRETLEVLAPEVVKLDDLDRALEPLRESVATLEPDDRAKFTELIDEMRDEPDDGRFPPVQWLERADERYPDELWVITLWNVTFQIMQRELREGVLLSGLLINLVSALESVVVAVARYRYSLHPHALGVKVEGDLSSDNEFSLTDLLQLGSIDEARELSIERKASSLTSTSVSGWNEWCKKHLEFGLDDIAIDYAFLRECVERRNLYVHNRGRVSKQYLERLELDNPPNLGKWLPLKPEYLDRLAVEIEVIGIQLVVLALIKLEPAAREYAVLQLGDLTYKALEAGKFPAVKALSSAASRLKLGEDDALLFLFNGWIARRAMGENIDLEVERFDESAKAGKFKLAKLALLRRYDECQEMIPTLLAGDEISVMNLMEWPLFGDFRREPAFRLRLFDDWFPKHGSSSGRSRSKDWCLVARAGNRYHTSGCSRASASCIAVPITAAREMGYETCTSCGSAKAD